MKTKGEKTVKVITFIIIAISLLPWVYIIGRSILSMFDGTDFFFSRIYGFDAFLGTMAAELLRVWYVYLISLIIFAVCTVFLIIFDLNCGKKHHK